MLIVRKRRQPLVRSGYQPVRAKQPDASGEGGSAYENTQDEGKRKGESIDLILKKEKKKEQSRI
jgi:hypothetical protein